MLIRQTIAESRHWIGPPFMVFYKTDNRDENKLMYTSIKCVYKFFYRFREDRGYIAEKWC